MAQFLSKESYSASTQSALGGYSNVSGSSGLDLAKDINSLMGAIGAIGQDYQRVATAENTRVGELVARDKLIELGQKRVDAMTALNDDPRGDKAKKAGLFEDGMHIYDYYKNDINNSIATALADAKQKFGSDSQAYKAFESSYLMKATEVGQHTQLTLNTAREKEEKKILGEQTTTDLDSAVKGGVVTPQMMSDFKTSLKLSGMNDTQISALFTQTFTGHIATMGIDPKSLYNGDGTLNVGKAQSVFSQAFGAVASLGNDGKTITIKDGSGILQEHADTIANQWKQTIHVNKETQKDNILFDMALQTAIYDMKKVSPTTEDGYKKSFEETYNGLKNMLSEMGGSKANAKALMMFQNEYGVNQFKSFQGALTIAKDPTSLNQAINNGGQFGGYTFEVSQLKNIANSHVLGMLDSASKSLSNGDYAGATSSYMKAKTYQEHVGFELPSITSRVSLLRDNLYSSDVNKVKASINELQAMGSAGFGLPKGVDVSDLNRMNEIIAQKPSDGKTDTRIYDIKKYNIEKNSISVSSEGIFAKENFQAVTQVFTDDKGLDQSLVKDSFIQGAEITSVKMMSKGGTSQIRNVLSNYATTNRIKLDPLNKDTTVDALKQAGIAFYRQDWGLGEGEFHLLPTISINGINTPMKRFDYEEGMKGKLLEYEQRTNKNAKLGSIDFNIYEFEPTNSVNGITVNVYKGGSKIFNIDGNELTSISTQLQAHFDKNDPSKFITPEAIRQTIK